MNKTGNVISPELVQRLNNLYLKARFVVEGFIVGLHKSPYHGFSVEFSEHRTYNPGDEIRYIDWKLWAKTERYFIKQFEEETNLKCYILLDQSLSMQYKSKNITKLEYAQILSASLGYLMIKQQDAVGITLFDNQIRHHITPKSKRSHLNSILSIMNNIKSGPETNIAPILHKTAEIIKKRGLVILISDLFDDPDEIMSGLKHFRHRGHEVIVFHVLDENELTLNDYKQRTNFLDIESNEKITTEPWHIQKEYQIEINKFCNYFKYNCNKNNIEYFRITTEKKLELALYEYLIKRKKLG
tara:strand:+ start:2010 stop:2906 length:897 start_codon:yes stop_codon:yes gene_type:complete